METAVAGVKVVGPDNGREGFLGSIGVRFMIDGLEAGERFSLVEHPMSPRALAAPRAPAHARGRVQLRAGGADGRAAGRRRRRGWARRPRVQAARPVAHVLERRRRAVPDPRDHLAGRLRAVLPGALRPGRRDRGGPGRGRASSASGTASRCGRRRFPSCSSASGCSSATLSPAAGGPERRLQPGAAGDQAPSYRACSSAVRSAAGETSSRSSGIGAPLSIERP